MSDYFNGNELAKTIFYNKYSLNKTETPQQLFERVSNYLSQYPFKLKNGVSKTGEKVLPTVDTTEKLKSQTYDLVKDFKKLVPNGSVLAGIGTDEPVSLSNCFVVSSPHDSYGGIFETDEYIAQIAKRRGGVGFDISTLRPAGANVNNAAKTSTGAVSFLERYSHTTNEVAQSGRRGALIVTIDIKHPDVFEFATIKRDLTKVTGANLSIKLSGEFMNAVKNNDDFLLTFPVDKDFKSLVDLSELKYNKLYPVEYDNGKVGYVKKVKAKKLWDTIIDSAHSVAEPGLIFYDTMIDYAPDGVYEKYKVKSTNPCCFTKNSRVDVITDKGIKDIKDITSNDKVWLENKKIFVKTLGYFDTGKQETFKVTFSNGVVYHITGNHKLPKIKPKRIGTKINKDNFELVELRNLKVGDEIRVQTSSPKSFGNKGTYEEGLLLGWISGDGHLHFKNSSVDYPDFTLDFWKNEHDIVPIYKNILEKLGFNNKIRSFINKGNNVLRLSSSRLTRYFTEKYEFNIWKFRKGRIPFLYEATEEFIKGYLSAYFTADGTVGSAPSSSRYVVSLASIDKERLYQVQTLLSNFGIKSSIGLLRKGGVYKDYSYRNTKDVYRLSITGIKNIRIFKDEIGFLSKIKKNKLDEIVNNDFQYQKSLTYTKIVSIESEGINDTGCINVPGHNYFTANGVVTGNSEIGMGFFDACRLMTINLVGFVKNPYTENAYFDFNDFQKSTYLSMLLMDNLINEEEKHIKRIISKIEQDKKDDPENAYVYERELNLWKKILNTALETRRTGLGFMGLADMLASLGIKYDSDEALDFVDDVMKFKLSAELDATIDLAIMRGTFKGYDKSKEYDKEGKGKNKFFETLRQLFPEKVERMKKYGRRNLSWSTVAPTGSISLVAQVSSGIEPVFMPYYIKRNKVNDGDDFDFVDEVGVKWKNYFNIHPGIKRWLEVKGYTYKNEDELKELVKKSPYYKSFAQDIDWQKRVDMQSVVQKYTTHSISSTINLPENISKKVVSDIYFESWNRGLKGITVYRDGSRSGVYVSTDKEKKSKDFQYTPAYKRPKKIKADAWKVRIAGRNFNIFVGLINNLPYEIFAMETDAPVKTQSGYIEKLGSGKYVFSNKDVKVEISNKNNPTEELLVRSLSRSLRHGSHYKFIIKDIEKTASGIFDFPTAIEKALSNYLTEDDVQFLGISKCPSCGENSLRHEGGCTTCMSCGWGACK